MALFDIINSLISGGGTSGGSLIPIVPATDVGLVKVPSPGTFGGITVTIAPFVRIVAGELTSKTGTGQSIPINIGFDKPVSEVSITCHGPNFPGNVMVAFDANGHELGRIEFAFKNNPITHNFFDRKTLSFPGIRRVELIPPTGDYVTYLDMTVAPAPASVTVTSQPPPNAPVERTLRYATKIRIIKSPLPAKVNLNLTVDVKPAVPAFDHVLQVTPVQLRVSPIQIPMEQIIEELAKELTDARINRFFDDDRVLKTVLNFGNDFQMVVTNWIRDPNDPTLSEILVKLYQPLPVSVSLKDLLWISRELSPTLLDQISIIVTPAQQIILFLRPPNRNINAGGLFGSEVNNLTLEQLLPSGSIITSADDAVLKDPLLEEFFTTDLSGVDLNVDYTDYTHFVHFSSAENRLIVFREKLVQLEDLNRAAGMQISAASGTVSNVSGSANFRFIQSLLEQRQGILRGFDGYEKFLYFDTGSFTGSLSGLPEDPAVTASVSWPKVSGSVLSVTESAAITFFEAQSGLAALYDNQNAEWIVNNIPQFIQFDASSAAFQTFLNMIGHHFDLVKLYIDNLTKLYDRDPDPSRGLSKELLWHVAQSLGIELPNQYAIKSLVDFAIGQASATQKTYSDAIAETWKRFIHNQIFIAKSKGTRTSLQTLLNSYGVLPELIRIRESVTPTSVEESGSFEDFVELSHVLDFVSGSHLVVPFSSSGYDPDAIELRFAASEFASGTLLEGDTVWTLLVVPTGSHDKGKLQLLNSTGGLALETTVGEFYGGDYFTVLLRRNNSESFDLTVKKFSQGIFDYSYGPASITDGDFTGSWSVVQEVNVGAFSGSVDEFRIWLEVTENETFDNHVKFPGMYAGNTQASARDTLLWRHSMVIPRNLGVTGTLPNDSPFIDFHTGSIPLSESVAVGFPSITTFPFNFEQVRRDATRFVFNAGHQFAMDTIRIAPPPVFDSGSLFFVSGSDPIPMLHRERSIRSIVDKHDTRDTTPRIGFYLTLAETINDSIMRSVGDVELNNLIGDPRNLYSDTYPDLVALNEFYHRNYAFRVDYNKFITFAEGLLEGLFSQAKKLVPARADLLTGIVIEPTILERNRIVLNQPIKLEGANTRRDHRARTLLAQSGSYPDARNVDALIVQSGSGRPPVADIMQILADVDEPIVDAVSGEASQLEARLLPVTQSLFAGSEALEALIVESDVLELAGADLSHETLIDLLDFQEVFAFTTPLDGVIPRVSDAESIFIGVPTYNTELDLTTLVFTRVAAEFDTGFVAPYVQSANDLTTPEGTTYFTHPSGSFGVTKFVKVRVREGIITDRGDWVKGDTYFKNDVVTQVSQSGDAAAGNGLQFQCRVDAVLSPTGSRVNFASYLPPSQDRRHWVPVAFISEATIEVRKAVHVDASGSFDSNGQFVAIVPFTGSGTPFLGYAPTHYRFFRDQSLRYRRPRFIGCLQTSDSTSDGKSPVEVLPSVEAQLFVSDGNPIQNPNDEGGPLLTVR